MKHPVALALSMVALTVATSLASPLENEFLQLREKRDKALATVAEPINDGYRASLEQLLQRANTEEDKDTAAKVQFELQALKAETPAANPPEQGPAPTPEMIALQQALADTHWRIDQDKTFVLEAGGHSTSSWTPRRGHWKVLDATTVQLDVGNIRRHEKVAVSQAASLLTWAPREADETHPQVAQKIVPVSDH